LRAGHFRELYGRLLGNGGSFFHPAGVHLWFKQSLGRFVISPEPPGKRTLSLSENGDASLVLASPRKRLRSMGGSVLIAILPFP